MSGRAALVAVVPRQWMLFPQLQIGTWQVLDMTLEVTGIVLFDHKGAEGRINLGVALGEDHGDLLSRVLTISSSGNCFCDARHKMSVCKRLQMQRTRLEMPALTLTGRNPA